VLAGFLLLPAGADYNNMWAGRAGVALMVAQVVLLWFAFDELWPRIAISITAAVLLLGWVCKWWFPHYAAPVACLLWFLQIEGLRRMWHWRSAPAPVVQDRASRRRKLRQASGRSGAPTLQLGLRNLVCLFPVVCLLALGARVGFRMRGGTEDRVSPEWQTLLTDKDEWSLKRDALKRWLEGQPGPQLVFVQYVPIHDAYMEWVYNGADLVHAKVIWARDLGAEHNRLLLQQMPERKVWSLAADKQWPRLVPYSEDVAVARKVASGEL